MAATSEELAVYNRIAADLNRYRHFRWYIPIWTISFLGAAAAVAENWQLPLWVRILAAIVVGIVVGVSYGQLRHCFRSHAENRRALREIEEQFPQMWWMLLEKWRSKHKREKASNRDWWVSRVLRVLGVLWVLRALKKALRAVEAFLLKTGSTLSEPWWRQPLGEDVSTRDRLMLQRWFILMVSVGVFAILAFLWGGPNESVDAARGAATRPAQEALRQLGDNWRQWGC